MTRKGLRTFVVRSFALVVVLGAAWKAQAQDIKTTYPSMAPLDQYLMERNAEIALARSAAPESISKDAAVMVLGRHSYETAIQGKNGFVCVMSGFVFSRLPTNWDSNRDKGGLDAVLGRPKALWAGTTARKSL